jgi:hypothetical protein
MIAAFFSLMSHLCGRVGFAAQESGTVPTLTKAQWQEDVQYLARELIKRHKNAFHHVTSADFERAIAELERDIPSLEDHEIVVRMLQITAKVGDAHTYVHLPLWFQIYPLVLYWFGDELRVISVTPAYQAALGARVVKLADMRPDEVNERLRSVLSQDENEWFNLSNGPGYMVFPDVLHTLGVVKDVTHTRFTFENDQGQQFSLDIRAIARDTPPGWLLFPKALPLYRQRPTEQFWFVYLEDTQTVYVDFRGYNSFSRNAEQLLEFVDRHATKKLVIDMRQNGGGDFTKVRKSLIPPLKRRPNINQKGHLFVVIGRRTFSAAMTNAIDFRKETNAILVGEPVGEKPNSFQENDEFTLPNSRLKVSYSTRYYKFQDEDTPTVMPDIRIDPSWEAFRAGRDPVMEWILAYPAGK